VKGNGEFVCFYIVTYEIHNETKLSS